MEEAPPMNPNYGWATMADYQCEVLRRDEAPDAWCTTDVEVSALCPTSGPAVTAPYALGLFSPDGSGTIVEGDADELLHLGKRILWLTRDTVLGAPASAQTGELVAKTAAAVDEWRKSRSDQPVSTEDQALVDIADQLAKHVGTQLQYPGTRKGK
ncbi:hypothetical protein [Mycobacteroides abscessus]|uniref:hypothetical protein n=2 Tax=Mycobacteroides abscessus TaxID=36809 RepID=UPI00092739BC|nr:hypothetical protein [Mycobacteroides abscessus]SID36349.1 Uncharacterised protein [Mycobacteroides abscessus subsp. abscessus]SKT92483.1 Uncharacterised protein [Mycobacteroides abscessus subsp. massiliense]SKU12619.1 Uncharacterised protein [Mycobacteroides abscessus subsp. massiliense]